MSNIIMFISFKLAEGASVPDFLLVSEKVQSEFMSKQKGYISWQQLIDGDLWADMITWQTMEDAENAMKASMMNSATGEFFSFLDEASVKMNFFAVKKSY
jgi:hypothetical protein